MLWFQGRPWLFEILDGLDFAICREGETVDKYIGKLAKEKSEIKIIETTYKVLITYCAQRVMM